MPAEARYHDDALDEVVAHGVTFHLERLDTGAWWIGLTHPDGTVDHITLATPRNGRIEGRYEENV